MAWPILTELLRRIARSRHYQFWTCQFIGWSGLSLVSFLSLNLWYNQPEASYLIHNIVQSIIGALVSWPMRGIFADNWHGKILKRVLVTVGTVLFFALLWSVARLVAFMALTGERGLWSDFGGWYYPSFFIFLCWSALYYVVKYYQMLQLEHASLERVAIERDQINLQRIQAETIAKEAQLKMLRYQLNPHFLFNTLNAISSLIQTERNSTANAMLIKLSQFLRSTLDRDHQDLLPLEREIETAQLYLDIEQLRFSDRLQVHTSIPPEAMNIRVPSLILQPLLENAIKYGIATSPNGGVISIDAQLSEHDKYLQLLVSDTGPGFSEVGSSTATGLGVGIKNTRDRLSTLYGDNYKIDVIRPDEPGARIQICLPVMDE